MQPLGFGGVFLRKLIIVAAALLLAGCVSMNERLDDQMPASANMKEQIISGARDWLRDPYSIRDAEISYVIKHPTAATLMVCVKANAKNAMGGYTGRKPTMVFFNMNRQATGAIEGQPFCYDQRLKWQPFPEIYALRNI